MKIKIAYANSAEDQCVVAFDVPEGNTVAEALERFYAGGDRAPPLQKNMSSSGLTGGSLTFEKDKIGISHDNADQLDPPVKPEDDVAFFPVVGIFNQKVSLDHVLSEHDRIEIYRPLKINPKEKRRLRAKRKI